MKKLSEQMVKKDAKAPPADKKKEGQAKPKKTNLLDFKNDSKIKNVYFLAALGTRDIGKVNPEGKLTKMMVEKVKPFVDFAREFVYHPNKGKNPDQYVAIGSDDDVDRKILEMAAYNYVLWNGDIERHNEWADSIRSQWDKKNVRYKDMSTTELLRALRSRKDGASVDYMMEMSDDELDEMNENLKEKYSYANTGFPNRYTHPTISVASASFGKERIATDEKTKNKFVTKVKDTTPEADKIAEKQMADAQQRLGHKDSKFRHVSGIKTDFANKKSLLKDPTGTFSGAHPVDATGKTITDKVDRKGKKIDVPTGLSGRINLKMETPTGEKIDVTNLEAERFINPENRKESKELTSDTVDNKLNKIMTYFKNKKKS